MLLNVDSRLIIVYEQGQQKLILLKRLCKKCKRYYSFSSFYIAISVWIFI